MCQRLVCQKREFVRSSSCEVYDPKLKNGIFFRIDMKHSYFLFPINFSVVETCQRLVVRRWSLLQDCLPAKFKDPKFMKFFHENRHEAFILFKLFHNFFAIFFSIIKVIIELFVV